MALISTLDVITWMGFTSSDRDVFPKLDNVASAMQDFADSYTNRKLEAKRYLTDPYYSYLDGNDERYIYVPQYPVSYVSSVNIDNDRAFGSATLVASADLFWYPNGKIVVEGDYFASERSFGGSLLTRGRRNVLIDYTAGFAPVVGGTHNSAVSSYPLPLDLKQVMLEMVAQNVKEGMTALHTAVSPAGDVKFIQMLTQNSFWRNVLDKYKAFSKSLGMGRDE